MKLNIVPARTGLVWFREGLRTFWRQPLALAGLFFMYFASAMLLMALPYLGFVLALAIVPAATLGLMAATREATEGKFPMPSILISAFRAGRARLHAMLVLGGLYATACVLVTLLALWLAPLPDMQGKDVVDLITPGFQRHLTVTMILYLPVSVMFWHAPALVHWHGISPFKSLFFSAVACVRNIAALAVYLLAWTGLFMAASMVLVVLSLGLGGTTLLASLIFPSGMMLGAMFFSSIWFTFRDSFIADEQAAQPSA